jgi:HK97 gp10 family phage protein
MIVTVLLMTALKKGFMANSLTIEFKGFDELKKRLSSMEKKMVEDIDSILDVNAEDIATNAKQRAPVDEGNLRQSISADNSRLLEKHITVNAFYAAFLEFGTGKYAAEYVGSLPPNWQTFAAQFRGKTGRPFDAFLIAMQEWVRRKGIATGKDYKQVAYLIAIKIIKNGIKPQPFLFPAFNQQIPIIIENINTVLNEM